MKKRGKFIHYYEEFWISCYHLKLLKSAQQLYFYIKEHHELHYEFIGHLTLKFHLLTHYPGLLLKHGAPLSFWCMRYESRHRDVKAAFNATSGSNNPLVTVGIKESLKICNVFRDLENRTKIAFGPYDENLISAAILSVIPGEFISNAQFFRHVSMFGEYYDLNTNLLLEIEETNCTFGQIQKMIYTNETIYFVLQKFEEVDFDEHKFAYIVKNTNKFIFVNYEDLPNFPPCSLHPIKGINYVTTSYGV